jgi:hypothetical protein
MKPVVLSRRSLLRGASGVAIALPWLEAMRDAQAAEVGSAKRFVAVYQPGGTVLNQWTPTGTETEVTLSPILSPLTPIAHEVIVLSGLSMLSAIGEQRQSGIIALLTGTPQGQAGQFAKGPSLDQVLAGVASTGKLLPSLEQAIRWGTGKANGMVHAGDIVNFADDATFSPKPPRLDPEEVWSTLFGALEVSPPGSSTERGRSVLDYLERRYETVALRLGARDRARLEQHLERIRELELTAGELSSTAACAQPTLVDTSDYDPASGLDSAPAGTIRDLETDAAIPKVGRFMTDMLVMALSCDMTAVATLQWSDVESMHTFPWLGLPETHDYYRNGGGFHPVECAQIATWYSEQHAYLLQLLDQVDLGGHTLLDESVVFFGTEIQDPANHSKQNMPFLLAGGGGGLRGGRWLDFGGRSHNDLLVTLLNLFGHDEQTFGDPEYCEGPLTGLV